MNDRLDILIFGAHPDDAEIGMGGTIRKHTEAGLKVGICDLTQAEMSSNGTVETRRKEAERASELLKLSARTNLKLPDRGLYMTKDHVDAVTEEIRKWRPGIVFAPYWEDRHPDHVACSKIVQEAVFNAKLRNYMPGLPAVQVKQLYFYYINDVGQPDLVIDVTDVYEHKTAALRAYSTQFEAAGPGKDFVQTPLNQGYLERVVARDSLMGQAQGIEFAEGFATRKPVLLHLFSS